MKARRLLCVSVLLGASLLLSGAPTRSNHPSAKFLFTQGEKYYQQQEFHQAKQSWEKSLRIYQNRNNRQGQIQVLSRLSRLMIQQQQHPKAVTYLHSLVTLFNQSQTPNDLKWKAETLTNLGLLYNSLGDYSKALSAQNQARKIFENLSENISLGIVLLNLGNTYEAIGDYKRANTQYRKSLAIAKQYNDKIGEAITLGNLGAIHSHLGQDQQAITYFHQSLALHKQLNQPDRQAGILINLGSIYGTSGQSDRAIEYYKQGRKLAQANKNRLLEASVLSDLGLLYEDRKEYNRAIQLHQKSIQLAKAINHPQRLAKSLNNQGHTLLAAKQYKKAATSLEQAVKILDRVRTNLTDRQQISIFDTQLFSYNLLQQILIADNQPEAALVAAEQGRARAFAALLARRKSNNSQRTQPLLQPSPTLPEIRQIAKQNNATLVSYTLVPDDRFKFRGKQRGKTSRIFIWLVHPNGKIDFRQTNIQPFTQHLDLPELVAAARCLKSEWVCASIPQLIQEKTKNPQKPSPFSTTSRYPGLQELHQLLIAPIADLLPQNPDDRVIIIPHESLFLVPFAALQNPQQKHLIEQHTLLTAPSIQVLGLIQPLPSSTPPAQKAVIVGNPIMPKVTVEAGTAPAQLPPLPGTETEAIDIAKMFKTQPILGPQATKANLLKQLPNAEYIHLATHGLLQYGTGTGTIEQEVPGAIALTPTPQDTGLLTSSEILQLQLQAKLVVLSACDTGRGRITGDGVIGLSRAWLSTGVPSLVASLVAVPDSATATFMPVFYQELQQTNDYAKALRRTMLEIKQIYPEPESWAAFTLIGKPQ